MKKILERIKKEGVVTHYGTDLDQIIALEALRRAAGVDEIKVDRAPAGKPVSGRINVDLGDERAQEGITVLYKEGTVMFDHHYNGYPNTLQVLVEAGIDVPAQAVEVADTCDKASALDYRTGIALVRYLTPSQAWELAEAGLLTATLTDEQIAQFGLEEAVRKQKDIVDTAVKAVKENAVSDDVVLAQKFVTGGAFVAYELGYKIYASVTPHENGGVTFAINAAPGTKLPQRIIDWASELRKHHGSGIFIRPDGGMVVAGGPKNPDFSVPGINYRVLLNVLVPGATHASECPYCGRNIEECGC